DIEIEIEPEEPTRPSWLLDEPTWNDGPRVADDTETVPLAPEGEPFPGPIPASEPVAAGPVVAVDHAATRRAAIVGAIAGAVVAALVAGGIALIDGNGDSSTPSALASARPPVDVRN